MQTKNGHFGEHRTFPATKGLPVQESKEYPYPARTKKELKKIHTRRSRRFLKNNLDY